MDTKTGQTKFTIKSVSLLKNSEVSCACCKVKSGEIFYSTNNRIMLRADGVQYFSPFGGGLYGHKDCLNKLFGALLDVTYFENIGNMKVLPNSMKVEIIHESILANSSPSFPNFMVNFIPKMAVFINRLSM